MEVHFSDHELRDLKKEQRLRREEKEARESKINALLGLAEETIREERSGIDQHGRRYKAPPRTYSRAESTYCAAAPAPAPAPAPPIPEAYYEPKFNDKVLLPGGIEVSTKPIEEEVVRSKQEQEAEAAENEFLETPPTQHAAALIKVCDDSRNASLSLGELRKASGHVIYDSFVHWLLTDREFEFKRRAVKMALDRAVLTTAFRDYVQVLKRKKTRVEEEQSVVVKRWTGRQLTRREALEMRRRIKTPVELSREERQLRLRTNSLQTTRTYADEDRENVDAKIAQELREKSKRRVQVKGRPRLPPVVIEGEENLEEEYGPFRLDAVDVEERIAELSSSRDLRGARAVQRRPSGIVRSNREPFRGSGIVVARAALAAAAITNDVKLPSGREHKELRQRLYRLRKAQRAQFAPTELLGSDDVTRADEDQDDEEISDENAALKEIDALVRGLEQLEKAKARETRRKLGKLRKETLALGLDAEKVEDEKYDQWEREVERREAARERHAKLVAEENERKASLTQEGRRDARVKREKAELRAYRRRVRTDWLDVVTLVTRTVCLRNKMQAHRDMLYEREKRRATIVLRLRFRKFLPAWREWAAKKKIVWFCTRLRMMEKCRRSCRNYFKCVRAVQGAWRRRTLRISAALKLTIVQWGRVWSGRIFDEGKAPEPLHPWLVERACRQLVQEAYRVTETKYGALGRMMLDKQRGATFPTEEVVDDAVVRRRQIEVISLINEEAPGWVVPEHILNPPDVLENVSWDDESMSGVRSSLASVRSEVRAKMERNKERRSMRRSRHSSLTSFRSAASTMKTGLSLHSGSRVSSRGGSMGSISEIDENVGETRGPSVWDPDGDPRGAYAVPACPQCLTPVRDAETQACSEHCTYLAIGGHVAALEIEAEADAMALEEELSRSTPPDGVAALAATPSAHPDGDLEAAT